MFDDQPISNQPAPPGNLPVGEPEDMFGDTDPVGPAPLTSTPQADPTTGPPSERISAMSAGVLRPKGSTPPAEPAQSDSEVPGPGSVPASPQPGAQGAFGSTQPMSISGSGVPGMMPPQKNGQGMPQTMPPAPEMSGPVMSRGIVVTGIIVVVLLIIAGGGWWIYTSYIKAPTPPAPTLEEPQDEEDADTQQETEPASTPEEDATQEEDEPEIGNDVSEQQRDDSILFGELIDNDDDGLANDQEERLGTDPNNWDSDGDDLSDGNEVLIWETDPLNPDTDGDTYGDGLEVKSGYNPLGSGRIGEIPSSAADTEASTSTATTTATQ